MLKKYASKFVIIGGAIMLVVLAMLFVRHRPVSPGDWAAWIQAFASIFAIAGAWGAVAYQLRVSHEKAIELTKQANRTASEAKIQADRLAETAATRALLLLTSETAATFEYIAGKMQQQMSKRMSLRTERVEELQIAYRSFLSKDLTPLLLMSVLGVQRELAYCLTALRQIEHRMSISEDRYKRARLRAETVRSIFTDISVRYGQLTAGTTEVVFSAERLDFMEMDSDAQ